MDALNRLYAESFGIPDALHADTLDYRVCPTCKLGFFYPILAGSELLYERLQAFDWYYMDEKEEYKIAEHYLPKTGLVLEVGAGRGAFGKYVGADRYIGLEFNDKAIERAGNIGVKLIKESIEAHSQGGVKYNAVVSFQVLEHVADPARFIQGCTDCLRIGGILILAVPGHDGFVDDAINNVLDMPPHHVTHWRESTLRYLAPQYGLTPMAVVYEPVARYHYVWASKIVWEKRLRRLFRVSSKLLDCRLSGRIVAKMGAILAQLAPMPLGYVRGHTVVAIYRKR